MRKNIAGQKFGHLLAIKDTSNNDKWKHAIWQFQCVCGNIIELPATSVLSCKTKSCGCYRVDFGRRIGKIKGNHGRIGSDHPAWKGGITSEQKKIRNSEKYNTWRQAIFERDDYTCRKCKQRGGQLNAHHIESFNNNPNLRTEISNGITLCEDCHKDFHHQYGNNCTKQQFKQFMEGGNNES